MAKRTGHFQGVYRKGREGSKGGTNDCEKTRYLLRMTMMSIGKESTGGNFLHRHGEGKIPGISRLALRPPSAPAARSR